MLGLARVSLVAGLLSLVAAVACSGDDDATPASPALPTDPPAAEEKPPHADAGRAPSVSADAASAAPPPRCVQGGACTGEERCKTNEGGVSLRCSCAVGAFACMERTPAPPSTCVEGATCIGTSDCGVDDGSSVRRCRCEAGQRRCETLTTPSASCSAQNPSLCTFSRPDTGASSWLHCYERQLGGNVFGFVCSQPDPQSLGMSGITFAPACPSPAPTPGSSCAATSQSLACTCSSGCVCACAGTWTCL